jgi:hypothetical protein
MNPELLARFLDAPQAALSFMVQQATIIEPQVYRIQYPDIQYPNLIPVDTSGNEWAKSITFFSIDRVGRADWFHHMASDVPMADISRDKFEQGVEMAAVGYRYTLEELGQAMMVPNANLTTERADAARRAYEEFMDNIALRGDTTKNFVGLINNPAVTAGSAIADGTGSSALWSAKTADQMIRDANSVLTGVYTGSLTVEMADTILLPVDRYALLAQARLTNLQTTAMQWLLDNNVYTMQTGQRLTVRAVRGLETAGAGGTARMVAYRRDPQVLKLHLPMPHRFLPVWQTGPLIFDIPGIFRTGGTEIRRPAAVRYLDGI